MRVSTPPSDTARVASLHAVHEVPARLQPALQLEADHGAEAAHLALGQLVLGMGGQADVAHPLDLGVRLPASGR